MTSSGGGLLLTGTETLVCRPDRHLREVCILLGARIQFAVGRLPQLVKSTDYYPLQLFHVGTNASKTYGKSPGLQSPQGSSEGTDVQVIFCLILPVKNQGTVDVLCRSIPGFLADVVVRSLVL